MKQTPQYAEAVKRLLAHRTKQQGNQEPETEIPETDVLNEPLEEAPGVSYHVHHFPDALVIIKEPGAQPDEQVIDSVAPHVQPDAPPVPGQEQQPVQEAIQPRNRTERARHAILTVSFYLFLILASLLVQSSLPLNAPTATVTIIPKSQAVTLTGTLQLGRVIAPITLSQSQTVPTTGRGHQDARAAQGSITFYNGLFTSQAVQAGTVLTGADGVQIITDQYAPLPAANPPSLGQTSVSAHAVLPGTRGNIPAYDINTQCCLTAVKAVNNTRFHGGQDERTFQTVTKNDITSVSTLLKTTLSDSVTGALQAQLQPNEQLAKLPCTPTITSDHRPGQEATEVKATASETCSAVAYDTQMLTAKATKLLTMQATQKLGAAYSLVGSVQVSLTQATTHKQIAVLSFTSTGTWVYALNYAEQQHIKARIAGKTKHEAVQILTSLPGVRSASIAWGDNAKLPKDIQTIRLVLLFTA